MKRMLAIVTPLFFLCLGGAAQPDPAGPGESRILQPAAMQEDFSYLRKALEETHPGLYKHHSMAEMQHIMDSLSGLLDRPLAFFDFYKLIAHLISEVECEHTYCNPYQDFNKRIMQWKVLPLQLEFMDQKAYVVVNRSADTTIHFGDEVLSIDHFPIDSVRRVLYQYMPADGKMTASKDKMLSSLLFNVDYFLFIERPDAFELELKDSSGRVFTRRFDTDLRLGENIKLTMANPVNREVLALSARLQKIRKDPQRLELVKDRDLAILSIRDFGGDREKLFKRYDAFFSTIKEAGVHNLIINLADHPGGDEEFACELLSYLIDKPTRFIDNEYLIDSSSAWLRKSNLPKDVLAHPAAFIDGVKDGKIYAKALTNYSMELRIFDPKPNGFHGRVYFYVNGGTSSAASTCAANAQSHHLATIVGQETAGCFAGGGSTNGLDLVLPNSGITAHTSIVYCSFSTAGRDADRGVVPDVFYEPSWQDVRNGGFGWRDFMFELIKKN